MTIRGCQIKTKKFNRKDQKMIKEETKKSRKGQIHRTWVRVLIDEVKEKMEKYADEMKNDVIQNFIEYMETVDEKIKNSHKDKSFDLMVGREAKKGEEKSKTDLKRHFMAYCKAHNMSAEEALNSLN